MSTVESTGYRHAWVERFAPLGGIGFAVALLVLFFTASSDEYDDTPQALLAHAEATETTQWATAILAIATPALLGWFVAGLAARLAVAPLVFRSLVLVGGTVFITCVVVAFLLWTIPLVEDDLNATSANAYFILDDLGWVLLGTGGLAAGVMCIGASLGALSLSLVPAWLGWIGVALGVLAFASIMAVGIFGYTAWLIGAGALMLFRRDRAVAQPVA